MSKQIEALKQALEALKANSLLVNGDDKSGGLVWCMDGYYADCFDIEAVNKQTDEAITALNRAIADAALDKKADNARELELDYMAGSAEQYEKVLEQPAQQQCEHRTLISDGDPANDMCEKCREYVNRKPAQQEPTDSMGMPVSCGKPLCSPGNHHPLCKLAEQPAPAQEPVYVQTRHKDFTEWGTPLDPKYRHSKWAEGVEMRLLYADTPPAPAQPLTDELIPKPEWADTESDWVVMYLRHKSIFDADQIGAMLDFAAAASAAAHGTTKGST